MIIPKYVEEMIERRKRLAMQLMDADAKLTEWLVRNNIPVATEDYATGFEMYVNPVNSAERIREAIKMKGD